jgi:hypothetical protein
VAAQQVLALEGGGESEHAVGEHALPRSIVAEAQFEENAPLVIHLRHLVARCAQQRRHLLRRLLLPPTSLVHCRNETRRTVSRQPSAVRPPTLSSRASGTHQQQEREP